VLEFDYHPAREKPLGVVLVLAVLALIAWASWPSLGPLGCILYLAYMAPFLYPSHYRIDADGVTLVRLGVPHRYPWSLYRKLQAHRGGVFLSRPSGRGVYLVMDKSQQALLETYVDP
jgi:hypothetical protein